MVACAPSRGQFVVVKILGACPGHLIKPAMSSNPITPCRSLLAGDSERTPPDQALNRLQAGSYIPTLKPEQAPGYRTHSE